MEMEDWNWIHCPNNAHHNPKSTLTELFMKIFLFFLSMLMPNLFVSILHNLLARIKEQVWKIYCKIIITSLSMTVPYYSSY